MSLPPHQTKRSATHTTRATIGRTRAHRNAPSPFRATAEPAAPRPRAPYWLLAQVTAVSGVRHPPREQSRIRRTGRRTRTIWTLVDPEAKQRHPETRTYTELYFHRNGVNTPCERQHKCENVCKKSGGVAQSSDAFSTLWDERDGPKFNQTRTRTVALVPCLHAPIRTGAKLSNKKQNTVFPPRCDVGVSDSGE